MDLHHLWRHLPPAVFRDLRVSARIRRERGGTEVDRFVIRLFLFGNVYQGDCDRSTAGRFVRFAAFDHGPPRLQESLDTDRSASDRTEYLCTGIVYRDDPAGLA